MGTLTDRVIANNTIGRENLISKGVDVSENATNLEIMQKIADITGGGVEYTSIVYNADNTITLIDTNGVTHTVVCEYDGDKLIGATYDGRAIELTYDGEALVGIDDTLVDLSKARISGTGGTGETEGYADMIYKHFGVDKSLYPHLFYYNDISSSSRTELGVYFAPTFTVSSSGIIKLTDLLYAEREMISPEITDDVKSVTYGIMAFLTPTNLSTVASASVLFDFKENTYTNTDVGETDRYNIVIV